MSDAAIGVPVGVVKEEGGGSRAQVLFGEDCLTCDFEHLHASIFSKEWDPREASTATCPECGAEYELVARLAGDE